MRRALREQPQSRGEVVGVIDPARLYDTDACMTFAGFGVKSLREFREAGKLKHHVGPNGRHWYRGEDLIRVIVEAK